MKQRPIAIKSFVNLAATLFLVFLPLTTCHLNGQSPSATLTIPRVSRPPKLEDFLNGTPREKEATITGLRQRDPGDGTAPSAETTVYLSYDETNLYAVFLCQEKPGQVRARLAKREDIFTDDLVVILLDTFNDDRRAYMFFSNPLGVQLDGITTEGSGDDLSFDTLWHSEGRVTADGFIVWMSIPFKSLRFANTAVQTWGISVGRRILNNFEFSFWPYITRRQQGFVQQFATLEGLQGISPGRNLQLIPYGVFGRARSLDSDIPAYRTETDLRPGLDAKMVLHDALSLDLALNPDFSQVESDEPQVTLNQRFEVFFPEKRPFFIENSAFFQTPEQLFFSRRIADPEFGARLTGKIGPWTLGILAADDRAPGRRRDAEDPARDRRAGIGVFRMQREFGKQSSLGLLVSSRDFASSSNRIFSLDMRHRLNDNWVFDGQIISSDTRQTDGSKLSGPAYLARLSHDGKHFNYRANYSDRSPGFRTEVGFVPRADIRQFDNFGLYRWQPQKRRLTSFGLVVGNTLNWDRRGRLQDWQVASRFSLQLKGPTVFEVSYDENYELFENVGFRKRSTGLFFFSEWLKWLGVQGSHEFGTGVNYFPAPGIRPHPASSTNSRLILTLRPTSRARFDQTYIYQRLGTDSRPAAAIPRSVAIFNNHILRSKLNYQFTRELSLRAIIDYNGVLPNQSLVDLSRQKRFTFDALATYLLNPGTAFYIGYTDGYENLALDPGMPSTLRRIGSPVTSTGRQIFVKLSYLFRF